MMSIYRTVYGDIVLLNNIKKIENINNIINDIINNIINNIT